MISTGHAEGAQLERPVRSQRARIDLHDQQLLVELACPGHKPARRVEDEALAIEDEFVLPADAVHIAQIRPSFAGPAREHGLPLPALSQVVGRHRQVDDDLRATREGSRLGGAAVVPDVFADVHSQTHARHLDHDDAVSGGEVPLLIKDRVIWQPDLPVGAYQCAPCQDGRSVGHHPAVQERHAYQSHNVLAAGRHLEQRLMAADQEMVLEKKILGGIAGDG